MSAQAPALLRTRRRPLPVLFAALLLAASSPSFAADDDARARSREAFSSGAEALESGRAKEALALFQQAYELFPHYSTLYNIGLCERALGHPIEAAAAFRRFLKEGGAEVPAKQQKSVAQLIEESDARIATAKLRVTPSGAVTIDGRPVSGSEVKVNPGEHVAEATAEGYAPARKTFVAPLGGEVAVELALSPRAAEAPARRVDAGSAGSVGTQPAPARFNGLFWGLSGVSVAAAAAGGVTGGLALSDSNAYNDPATPDAEAEDRKSRGQVLRVVADVCFGAAIAAGVGAVLVAVRPIEAPAPGAASISVVPVVAPTQFGLGVIGRF